MRVLVACALAGLFACSSPATPPVATVSAQAADKPDSPEAEVSVDLSPVAAPEYLVALATLRTPARSLDTLMSWTGLGIDWRGLMNAGATAPFAPVLDL
jgi:hypothetical protein